MSAHVDAYIAYTHRFFNKWQPLYDLFALPIAHVYRTAARRAVPRRGESGLDVCTGTGQIALRCARRGAAVTAVDVTPAMLERARMKARGVDIDFRLLDARHLDAEFADASFDSVVLSFALHDMPRPVGLEVLRQAARVARRRLVILDYDFPRVPVLRQLLLGLVGSYETAYLKGFARDGVAGLVAEAGLPAARVTRHSPLLFAIHVITW